MAQNVKYLMIEKDMKGMHTEQLSQCFDENVIFIDTSFRGCHKLQ